jgi:hypothetical protein
MNLTKLKRFGSNKGFVSELEFGLEFIVDKIRIRSRATIAFSLLEFGLGLGLFRSEFSGAGFRRSEFSRW